MAKKRYVEKMYSIFNVKVHKALGLDERLSTRVMLDYDRNKKRKEFKVLNPKITSELNGKITSWLEENIDIDYITQNLKSHHIDIDNHQRTVNY